MRPRAWISWSSGKDCAWALHMTRMRGELDVVGLLTTINESVERISMHGVRSELLEMQAQAIGLPIHGVRLPWPCSNQDYETRMRDAMEAARTGGITHMIFGDLALEDVRRYREEKLSGSGIKPVFPLWREPTDGLVRTMIESGVRAYVTAVDLATLPASFAGRIIDDAFLSELPSGVDPCGENGEFHSFVSAGPMLKGEIPVRVGETIVRDGIAFADLLPR